MLATLPLLACDPPREATVPVVTTSPGPAPTPTKEPDPPVAISPETGLERIEAISVKRRLPDLAKDLGQADDVPIALVEKAIELASADMFVSHAARGKDATPTAEYELTDAGHFVPWPEGALGAGALDRFAGTTYYGYAPSSAEHVLSFAVDQKPLPDRSPGLVWDVLTPASTPVVRFVSLDGETYLLDVDARGLPIDLRVGPPERWPAPVPSPGFGRMAFAVSRRTEIKPLQQANKAFEKCADQAWARAKKKVSPDEEFVTPERARVVSKACAKQIAAWERTLAENIEASVKERVALFEKAKARVRSFAPRD